MLDGVPDWVDIKRLGQRQLLLAAESRVSTAFVPECLQHGRVVMCRQLKMLRIGAVTVENRGNLAIARPLAAMRLCRSWYAW